LSSYLGGEAVAGIKLKAKTGWYSGGNGTDDYNFSAFPGGLPYHHNEFIFESMAGYWWSVTEYDASIAYNRYILFNYDNLIRGSYNGKSCGFSVRLVRD
jgi:uncharacterized protein (TIGR02145 family)